MSKPGEAEVRELVRLGPDELVRLLREAITANLGADITAKTVLHYSGGWFYFNQARRYDDGSIGTIGPADGKRKRDIAALIIRHRQRADEKKSC